MGNITSKKSKNPRQVCMTPFSGRFACINSVFSLSVDHITGKIYVLRIISTGCIITEWGYDRLLVFSADGEITYSHKINYNFTNKIRDNVGSMRDGCQFDHHGIAFHNNLIYITNRSLKVISVITENAELISIIQMPHKSTDYASKHHYAYGIELVRERRGSTRLDVDNDGIFVCHYNSLLSIMHGMKPVYYEIVKELEGQTLDINIHMDKLHVLSRDGSTHTITVMTKDGIRLNVYIEKETILVSPTFTIDKSDLYYISDGVSVIKWNGENIQIIYTDETSNSWNNGIERGIKFDSRDRLVIFQNSFGSDFKLEFCT